MHPLGMAIAIVAAFLAAADERAPLVVPADATVEAFEIQSLKRVATDCASGIAYVISTPTAIAFASPQSCDESIVVNPVPAADLTIATTGTSATLARLELLSCTTPKSSGALIGRIRAEIDSSGTLRARVPIGCVQPRLFVPGFAPKRLGDIEVKRGEPNVVAAVQMQKGASIGVQVLDSKERVPIVDVEGGVDDGKTVLHGRSNASGWIFVDGIPADRIHVHVKSKQGLSQSSQPYAIEAGVETMLDAIEVAPPAHLTATVKISRELLDEGLTLLGVQVSSVEIAERHVVRHQEKLDDEGVAHFPPLLPGKWRVEVVGRLAGTTGMALVAKEITLQAGEDSTVELSVPHRIYRGRVTGFRQTPRFALLILQALTRGNPAFTLRLDSTAKFSVPLTAPAEYRGILQIDGQTQSLSIPSVKFDDPSKEVEVRLPSATVAGKVIDREGRAVAAARVTAEIGPTSARHVDVAPMSAEATTNADGTFEFAYADAGQWTISAEGKDLASQPVNVAVGEEQSVTGIVLIADRMLAIDGQVIGPGDVPQSRVTVYVWGVPATFGELPSPRLTSTDDAGQFHLAMPARGITMSDFVVETKDGTVAAVRRMISADDDFVLRVPSMTGSVRLRRSDHSAWPQVATTLQRLIAPDGAQIPLYSVGSMQSASMDRVLPRLAVGTWRVAEAITPDEMFRLAHGRVDGLITASFEVIANREVAVEVKVR